MNRRDDKVYAEAAELWQALYGEPPPREADGAAILDAIVGGLRAPRYGRLTSPHLRPGDITFPRRD